MSLRIRQAATEIFVVEITAPNTGTAQIIPAEKQCSLSVETLTFEVIKIKIL